MTENNQILEPSELFTTRMKKETRHAHSQSDKLINARLAFAFYEEYIWAQGVFLFYHLFAYIEDAKTRLNMAELDSLFVDESIYRKSAFELDLNHYLGDDWQTELKTEALEQYLNHLKRLEDTQPKMLIVYMYHLYMGLLSGGQLIKKKKSLYQKLSSFTNIINFFDTCAVYKDRVTNFGKTDIKELKTKIRDAMNKIAEGMSEQEKKAFIDESNLLFQLNNDLVRSIDGQNKAMFSILLKYCLYFFMFLTSIFCFIIVYRMENLIETLKYSESLN